MVISLIEKVSNYSAVFTTALGSPDKLIVDRVHVVERLSTPFEITVEAHSKENSISFKGVVGKPASVELSYQQGQKRYFSGVVGEVRHGFVNDETGFSHYTFKIYPHFWLAKFNQDYKIYQVKSASSIIDEVLGENGVTMKENKSAPKGQKPRKYCVRYGESAFGFCSRLMAEEGIHYHFTMSAAGDTLVMCGDVSQFTSVTPASFKVYGSNVGNPWGNEVQEFHMEERVVSKKSALADYNFVQPSNKLYPNTSGEGTGGKVYRYPGRFFNLGTGENLNKIQIEQLEWDKQLFYGRSTAPDLMAGGQLALTGHPRGADNGSYNIYEVEHFLDMRPNTQAVYQNKFICFPKGIPYRPDPIPKPRIYSNQVAIVTGPPGEEIHTDEHGRIKVQFYWDQYGSFDDKSSCWIRVSQPWSGAGWGFVFIPRIKMEVVVSFLEGDPDRPLVVGCVYNGNNKTPYPLPAEKTKSTIHTQSTKNGPGKFNEIRFEDKKGQEQLYVRAEKDYDREVMLGNRTLIIHEGHDTKTITKGNYLMTHEAKGPPPTHTLHMIKGDRIKNLDKGDEKVTLLKGNRFMSLMDGNETRLINGLRTSTITKDETITIGKNHIHTIGQNYTITSGANITIQAAGDITIVAGGTLTLIGASVVIG